MAIPPAYRAVRSASLGLRRTTLTRLAGGFGPWYELVLATLAELSDEQRADVLAATARRFYRLPADPASGPPDHDHVERASPPPRGVASDHPHPTASRDGNGLASEKPRPAHEATAAVNRRELRAPVARC